MVDHKANNRTEVSAFDWGSLNNNRKSFEAAITCNVINFEFQVAGVQIGKVICFRDPGGGSWHFLKKL